MTTGVPTCFGSLKWECLTKIGIHSPAQTSTCLHYYTSPLPFVQSKTPQVYLHQLVIPPQQLTPKLSFVHTSTRQVFEAKHLLLYLIL